MPITIHPRVGQILFCNFSEGFKEPEMVKDKRPVIIISSELRGRNKLVTVVPISSVKPDPIMPYHYLLPTTSLPMLGNFQVEESWVKGDIVYTVAFHRLDLIRLGTRNLQGKRNYYQNRLGRDQMKSIYSCVLHGLNIGNLAQHL
ncbi:type II toxin-antitoxin system PemK/MazF family toxin [Legionella longbeachae]|uniref:type II toxin-antitoxin system PemK/MazF family toxin n=1 Tax=Legionella longbeachae TaxID=450 RepID=UPI000A1C0148|nr:type II toxin-antitoxin system PemK/MazF family toxin [Legionella longbeachae]ARM32341.1 type II toxin-antitoxin system PemK/MazF family toxin [Legionella longbeachae]